MSAINMFVKYRDNIKSDGSRQLVLRITLKRKVKYFPIGFDVLPKHFDEKKQVVKNADPRQFEKNLAISNALSRAHNIENYFLSKREQPTIESFTRRYDGTSYNQDSFYEYAEMHQKRNKGIFSDATIDFYTKHIGKLKKFSPNLTFEDIDLDFLHAYKDHCYGLGNNDTTMYKSLEFIRRILNAAIKEDIIEKNPFRNFQIKNPRGNTEHLSIEELQQLEKLFQEQSLANAAQNVLRYFLFACYTGLRYSDVYNLRFDNLKNENGFVWLKFTQQKTNKFTSIPLTPQAVALIPEKNFDNAKMFRVVPNQTTNRHLKEIADHLEWNKRITFHVARNTCSNLLYRLGVPVEIRSLIVGDTPQVLRNHYTNTDADQIRLAMDEYGKAISKKIELSE
jgi:integrase